MGGSMTMYLIASLLLGILIGTIFGFVLGVTYVELDFIKQKEEELKMKLIASQVIREWKEKELSK
jgi:hypothetical protein